MNSFTINAMCLGASAAGSTMSVSIAMTREQQAEAVRAILGTFTAEAVVAFLVAEFGELVQERAA